MYAKMVLSKFGRIVLSHSLQSEILDGPRALDALKLRLAAQLAPQRWRAALDGLATTIDAGHPLDVSFEQQQSTVPEELRCLIVESLNVPEPTTLILDAVRTRQAIARDWRQLWQLLAYPMLLLGLALVVGGAFCVSLFGSPFFSIVEMYKEFGLSDADRYMSFMYDQSQAIVGLTLACGWTILVMLTIALLGPRWAWVAVLGGVVLIGRPLRWIALREVLNRYELFIGQGISPVAATQSVTRTFRHSSQSVAAAAIAGRIEAGMPLGQALCASLLSDGLTRPALRLLDLRVGDMPQGLAETGELLGSLTEHRCRGLAMLLPVFSIVFVGTIVWATLSVYLAAFVPLISMITSLA